MYPYQGGALYLKMLTLSTLPGSTSYAVTLICVTGLTPLPQSLSGDTTTAKDTNKYRYQAKRAFIIGRMKKCVPKILCDLCNFEVIKQLYEDAYRCCSQIISGRSFRRKKTRLSHAALFRCVIFPVILFEIFQNQYIPHQYQKL